MELTRPELMVIMFVDIITIYVSYLDSMVLLGSLQRKQLEGLLARYINMVSEEVSVSQSTTELNNDQPQTSLNDESENENGHSNGVG